MNNLKIIAAVIITGLLTFFLTREFVVKYKNVGQISDTTKVSKTKDVVTENLFIAKQIGNIKQQLIDSLKAVYGALKTIPTPKTNPISLRNWVSEIDSVFIAKDSSGVVTDSVNVKSVFISPEPLSSASRHIVSVDLKHFSKENETIITKTKLLEKKESFFGRFKIVPNISAGVGLINKQFDIYFGVGLCYEL